MRSARSPTAQAAGELLVAFLDVRRPPRIPVKELGRPCSVQSQSSPPTRARATTRWSAGAERPRAHLRRRRNAPLERAVELGAVEFDAGCLARMAPSTGDEAARKFYENGCLGLHS